MEKPRIAAKQPEVLTLEAGTYYWCQCGARGTNRSVMGPTKEPGSSRLNSY